MRAASLVNDQSMGELIPLTASGMNEVELGEELRKIYVKNGAVGHSFEPIVGFGDNGADPHHESDESTGKYGRLVLCSISGCLLNGYCSDMTRTVFLGKASDEARKIYEIVKEANRRGIEAVGPGARFSDVEYAPPETTSRRWDTAMPSLTVPATASVSKCMSSAMSPHPTMRF